MPGKPKISPWWVTCSTTPRAIDSTPPMMLHRKTMLVFIIPILSQKIVWNKFFFGVTHDKMLTGHVLTPMTISLYGFTSDSVVHVRRITLTVEMETPPFSAYYFMEFFIVDHRYVYHEVMDDLHWKNYGLLHLSTTYAFITDWDKVTIQSDETGSRKCYVNSYESLNLEA